MKTWMDHAVSLSGFSAETIAKLIETLILIAVILILRRFALRAVHGRVADVKRAYYFRRVVDYTGAVIGVVLVSRTWFIGLENLGTFFGLLSAGLAVALQDLLASFAGWIFILTRKPFSVGDRIEIGGHIGDVVDIRLFQTFLLECGNWVDADQSTGRIIMVPNGMIFKHTTANYTEGFEHVWDEQHVLITFESDWRRAKKLLAKILDEHGLSLSQGAQEQIKKAASQHMIFFQNLTPIVYTTVKDSGVQLSMRYLTPPRQRRGSAETIWEAILDAFAAEPHIDLAYPTTRYFNNVGEGKAPVGAPPPPEGTQPPPSEAKPEKPAPSA